MLYVIFFIAIIVLDRFTKWLALTYLYGTIRVNDFLSFTIALNRGITWGFFHSEESYMFLIVTTIIIGLTGGLCFYVHHRWKEQKPIAGELLVLAGSCSNIIDRLWYQGVVDFILLHWGAWYWPVFNIADVSIVAGVAVMMIQRWYND